MIRQNGALTPFIAKSREPKASPPAPNVQPAASSAQTVQHSAWSQPPAKQPEAPVPDTPDLSLESLKLLEAKERMIAEEQRKLREKEGSFPPADDLNRLLFVQKLFVVRRPRRRSAFKSCSSNFSGKK